MYKTYECAKNAQNPLLFSYFRNETLSIVRSWTHNCGRNCPSISAGQESQFRGGGAVNSTWKMALFTPPYYSFRTQPGGEYFSPTLTKTAISETSKEKDLRGSLSCEGRTACKMASTKPPLGPSGTAYCIRASITRQSSTELIPWVWD